MNLERAPQTDGVNNPKGCTVRFCAEPTYCQGIGCLEQQRATYKDSAHVLPVSDPDMLAIEPKAPPHR